MARVRPISEKKQKLIDDIKNSPISVGEVVYVKAKLVRGYTNNPESPVTCEVLIVNGDKLTVKEQYERRSPEKEVSKSDVIERDIYRVGVNPFDERHDQIRPIAYALDSILFGLDLMGEKRELRNPYDIKGVVVAECNFNPFIYNAKGEKEYYQRPLVWTLSDKQALIDSVYQGIDCGKILVRKRGFTELEQMQAKGETELSFKDIVDGKQRLNTIVEFMSGDFHDSEGNYFADLSAYSQRMFTDHQLFSYAEMPEGSKDEDVIFQFLKLNFAGVPQSPDHISFVKELYNRL